MTDLNNNITLTKHSFTVVRKISLKPHEDILLKVRKHTLNKLI